MMANDIGVAGLIRIKSLVCDGVPTVVSKQYFLDTHSLDEAWALCGAIKATGGDFLAELVDNLGIVRDELYLESDAVEAIVGLPIITVIEPFMECHHE